MRAANLEHALQAYASVASNYIIWVMTSTYTAYWNMLSSSPARRYERWSSKQSPALFTTANRRVLAVSFYSHTILLPSLRTAYRIAFKVESEQCGRFSKQIYHPDEQNCNQTLPFCTLKSNDSIYKFQFFNGEIFNGEIFLEASSAAEFNISYLIYAQVQLTQMVVSIRL